MQISLSRRRDAGVLVVLAGIVVAAAAILTEGRVLPGFITAELQFALALLGA